MTTRSTAKNRMSLEKPVAILFAEDVEADTELAVRALNRGGLAFSWERVDTPSALAEALRARSRTSSSRILRCQA